MGDLIHDRKYEDLRLEDVEGSIMAGVDDPTMLVADSWTPEQKAKWTRQFNAVAPSVKKRLQEEAEARREARFAQHSDARAWRNALPPVVREVAGGIVAGVGDLGALGLRVVGNPEHGQENLADTANRVLSRQAAVESQASPGFMSEALRGSVRSLTQAAALAATGGASAAAKGTQMIGGFAASRANQAMTEATDAGLTGASRARYVGRAALIEGGIAGAFQALGLGGAEKLLLGGGTAFSRAGAKEFLKQAGYELVEENVTEILDATNQAVSKVSGPVTPAQLLKVFAQTTTQTLLTLGLAQGKNELVARGLAGQQRWTQAQADAVVERATKAGAVDETALGREVENEERLTPEGLATWATSPEGLPAARALVAGPPSRSAFDAAKLPSGRNLEERKAIVAQIAEILKSYDYGASQTAPPTVAPPTPAPAGPMSPAVGGQPAVPLEQPGKGGPVRISPPPAPEAERPPIPRPGGQITVTPRPPKPEDNERTGRTKLSPDETTDMGKLPGAGALADDLRRKTAAAMAAQDEVDEHDTKPLIQPTDTAIGLAGRAAQGAEARKSTGKIPTYTDQVREKQKAEIAAIVPGSTDWRTADVETLKGIVKDFKTKDPGAKERLDLLENPIAEGADWRKTESFKELAGLLAAKAIEPENRRAAEERLVELAGRDEASRREEELRKTGLAKAEAEKRAKDEKKVDARPSTVVGGFTTAKGSRYVLHEDGSTTRDKAERNEPGHEGDKGPKERSARTYFVTQEQADQLALVHAQGAGRMGIVETPGSIGRGRIGVRYLEGKDAGRFEGRTVTKPADGPAVGLTPVEVWGDGSKVHFGSPITALNPLKEKPPEVPAKLPEVPAKPPAKSPEVKENKGAKALTREAADEEWKRHSMALRGAMEALRPKLKDGEAAGVLERARDAVIDLVGKKVDSATIRSVILSFTPKLDIDSSAEEKPAPKAKAGKKRHELDVAAEAETFDAMVRDLIESDASPDEKVSRIRDLAAGRGVPEEAIKGLLDEARASRPEEDEAEDQEPPAPPAPPKKKPAPPKKPADAGLLGTLSAEKQARAAALKEKIRRLANPARPMSGVDPELLLAGAELTALYVEGGARSFAKYVRTIMRELGTSMAPHLRGWWAGVESQVDAPDDLDPTPSKADGKRIIDEAIAELEEESEAEEEPEAEEPGDFDTRAREIILGPEDRSAKSRLMKALAAEHGLTDKQVQERIESVLVELARDVAQDKDLTRREKFDRLVAIYGGQPNLSARTGWSKLAQAYSTPVPLAYAASLMAGVDEATTLYEPTAGMGALTITADPAKTTVNDFSDGGRNTVGQGRLAELGKKGYAAVTDQDALSWAPEGQFDRVMANPPFGGAEKLNLDGYPITKLEHRISLKALERMKDDGRAALILGASLDGTVAGSTRIFLNYVLNHYHVAAIYRVHGDLYKAQGAGAPVLVVVVSGRRVTPLDKQNLAPTEITELDDWNQVWNAVEPTRIAADQAQAAREAEGPSEEEQDEEGETEDAEEPGVESGGPPPVSPPGPAPRPGKSTVVPEGKAINDRQQEYVPASSEKPIGTIVSTMLAPGTARALSQLANDFGGDVDAFVQERLGGIKGLAAEQVDGVGLAIRNIESGRALIIGDQTGIGKGRQAAALIAYAKKRGWIPVFMTADPKLFSDMYADTTDIGKTVSPFLIGNPKRATIKDPSKVKETIDDTADEDEDSDEVGEEEYGADAVLVKAGSTAAQKGVMARVVSGETSLEDEGFDAVFLPYSQLGGHDNPRHAFLTALSKNQNVMYVMDESHKAAGAASITGAFMRGGTVMKGKKEDATEVTFPGVLNEPGVRGVVYLSATYAKRPETMPLYYKTSLGVATDDAEKLQEAFKHGGVALQQWAANALTDSGEMIRRERDFAGVRVDRKFTADTPEAEAEAIEGIDRAAAAMLAIRDFSRMASEVIKELGDRATAETESRMGGADFASVMHNYVSQLLLASKVKAAAAEAIASHKKGEATLIVLSNTMESFLKDFTRDNGIALGQPANATFADVLRRALDRTMRSQGETATGSGEVEDNTAEALGLEDEYNAVLEKIEEIEDLDFPTSPIDALHHALRAAGLRTGELTGRSLTVDANGRLAEREDNDKNATVNAFNQGKLDVVILNSSGATGLSMHASVKNPPAGQKPRHMIIAQPDLNIDTVKQVIGRILRTGMVGAPKDFARYTLLSSPVEAEKRPFAVLASKLASLNANTTAETEDDFSLGAVDFMNKYGDRVVAEMLREDVSLTAALNMTPDEDSEVKSSAGLARKVTGRLAVLPNARQKEFYIQAQLRYDDLVQELRESGEYDLEVEVQEEWDAKLETSQVMEAATDPSHPFLSGVNLTQWSINDPRRPMKAEEVRAAVEREFGGSSSPDGVGAEAARLVSDYLDELKGLEADYVGVEPKVPGPGASDGARAHYLTQKKQYDERVERVNRQRHKIESGLADLVSVAGSFAHVDVETGERDNRETTEYRGVLIGMKLPVPQGGGNPYRPATVRATFAVEAPRRTVSFAIGKIDNGSISVRPESRSLASLDSFARAVSKERAKRSIFTGNLVRALATTGKGQITAFKTSDGQTVTGLVMPGTWKMSDANNDPRTKLRSGEAAAKFMGEVWGGQVRGVDPDGKSGSKLRVTTNGGHFSGTRYELEVAAAKSGKSNGGIVYLDKDLLKIVGDFVSRSDKMVVRGLDEKDFVRAMEHLIKRGFTMWAVGGTVRDVAAAHGEVVDDRLGAPAAPAQPKAPAPALNVGLKQGGVQPAEVLALIEKEWGVPIRGPATFRRKFKQKRALGWYSPGLGEIRLKSDVEIVSTAIHELGHHFDRELGAWSRKRNGLMPAGVEDELQKLGEALYGGTVPGGAGSPLDRYRAEGFAEFIREYVTAAPDLYARAPNLYRWFTMDYLPGNAEEAAKLRRLAGLVLRFQSQTPAEAIEAIMRPQERDWSAERILADTQEFVDNKLRNSLYPILRSLQATGLYHPGELSPKNDPAILSAAFAGTAGGRTKHAALNKTVSLHGLETGDGLREVLLKITSQGAQQYKEWKEFAVAKVGLQRMDLNPDYNPGFSRKVAEAIVAEREGRPYYLSTLEALTEFSDRALEPLVESGFMTPAEKVVIRLRNPLHVSLMRQVRAEGGRLGGGKSPVHRTTEQGSHLGLLDPIDAALLQYAKIQTTAMQHEVVRSLVAFYDKHKKSHRNKKEAGTFLSKLLSEIPLPDEATRFSATQLDSYVKGVMDEAGVDDKDQDAALETYWDDVLHGPHDASDRQLTVFTKGKTYKGALSVVVNGKRRLFQLTPELLEALSGLAPEPWVPGAVGRAVRKITAAQRIGITGLNPAFSLVRNLIRDVTTAVIYSDYGSKLEFKRAFKALVGGEYASRYSASGVAISGYHGQDLEAAQDLASQATGHGATRYQRVIRSPLNTAVDWLTKTEAWPRLVEYHGAHEWAMKKWKDESDAAILAAAASRDLTVDFKRAGSWTRKANEVVLFANAAVQSADKALRSFGLAEPAPWASKQDRAEVAAQSATRAAALTAAALLIYLLFNRGNKDWEELEPHQKWSYLNIPYGNGRFFKIPLPFEVGSVFAALPVALVDGGAKGFAEAGRIAIKNASPIDMGSMHELARNVSFLAPMVDVLANKDWKGAPIVPETMRDNLIAAQQHGPHASAPAKALGALVSLSPAEIDHVLNGYTGGLYQRVASLEAPTSDPATWWVAGTLFSRPGQGSRVVREFYDRLKELRQRAGSKVATLEEIAELAAAERLDDSLTETWKARRVAEDHVKADAFLVSAMQAVRDHAKRDPKADRSAGLGLALYRATEPSLEVVSLAGVPRTSEDEALNALRAEVRRRAVARGDKPNFALREGDGKWTAFGRRRARLLQAMRER